MILGNKLSYNIVGKGENAGDQHFLLSPQCFLTFQRHPNYQMQMLSTWKIKEICPLMRNNAKRTDPSIAGPISLSFYRNISQNQRHWTPETRPSKLISSICD